MGYHFFPRRKFNDIGKKPNQEHLDKGYKILESILRFGLLLKPESTFSTGGKGLTPRICFTEDKLGSLCRQEVEVNGYKRSHFEIFGTFAICIDNRLARRLGLCPVLTKASLELNESVSEKLIGSLSQVHNTLSILAHIESLANPEHDYFQGRGYALPWKSLSDFDVDLRTTNQSNRENALLALKSLEHSAYDIEKVFDTLNPKRNPFWQLSQFVTMLADLEQEADSSTNKRYLAYYRQREWRIQRCFYQTIGIIPLSEKQIKLTGSDFEGDIEYRNSFNQYWSGDYNIGDDEWLLTEVELEPRECRKRICEIVSEIVCPDLYADNLRELIEELNVRGDQLNPKITTYPIGATAHELEALFNC